MELVLAQLDLRRGQIRSKRINLPPLIHWMDQIMSTRLLTYQDQNYICRSYDVLTKELSELPQVCDPLFLASGSVFS